MTVPSAGITLDISQSKQTMKHEQVNETDSGDGAIRCHNSRDRIDMGLELAAVYVAEPSPIVCI